jgi:predicted secreted protein
MATHTGKDGTIRVGATDPVGELRSFNINESADTVEDTTMGDTARTRKATLTSWDGSVECYWDENDTSGQVALGVGTEVADLRFYPEGTDAGDTYYYGACIVTGVSRNVTFDGMIEMSITVEGNGALSTDTV